MGTSKTTNTYNRQNWEDSDFPILCETCLGENPYIRMTKEKYGKECKICARPFTVFRWCPGAKSRFKKTEVCQTCSKIKNVCQTCILDLEYGLPIQVRDKALRLSQNLPRSEVNREYFQQQVEHSLEKGGDATVPYGQLGKAQPPSDLLLKLARTTPYYRRNRPHICSFWVKGECKRGEECAYRHEKPSDPDDPLSNQNIRDRFYGVGDPVADKLMQKYETMPKLEPPEDKAITTLYVGGLSETMTEEDMRSHFYQYGEIRSISVHPKQRCAFIQYTTREAAEKAAEKSFDKLILQGRRLTIKWGRPQSQQSSVGESGSGDEANKLPPVPGLPAALPMPPPEILAAASTSSSTGTIPPGMPPLPSGSQLPPFFFRGPPPPPNLHSQPHSAAPPPPPPPPGMMMRLPAVSAAPNVDNPMHSHLPPSEPLPPGTSMQYTGVSRMPPPTIPPPNFAFRPPTSAMAPGIHYPSQNPEHLGSFARPPPSE